jgi:hypothetical protein
MLMSWRVHFLGFLIHIVFLERSFVYIHVMSQPWRRKWHIFSEVFLYTYKTSLWHRPQNRNANAYRRRNLKTLPWSYLRMTKLQTDVTSCLTFNYFAWGWCIAFRIAKLLNRVRWFVFKMETRTVSVLIWKGRDSRTQLGRTEKLFLITERHVSVKYLWMPWLGACTGCC